MDLREIVTRADLELAFPVVRELRPHLAFPEYVSLYEEARRRDEFTLVGCFDGGSCVAVMGYRVLVDFLHGRHLYIDDLVVASSLRSQGIGKRLLDFAEREADRLECLGLRLCTGVQNERGRVFYERHGWTVRALAYKKGTRS